MVTFLYYENRGLGGAEQLIINLSLGLNKIGEIPKVYCYQDSYIFSILNELKINFFYLSPEIIPVSFLNTVINENDVYVMFGIQIEILESLRRKKIKFIIYLIHTETFINGGRMQKLILKYSNKILGTCLQYMNSKNALYFMDGDTYNRPSDFAKIKLQDINYIPIPICGVSENKYSYFDNETFVITYIGRGNAYWKIYPAKKIYDDLKNTNLRKKIELHIITDDTELYREIISINEQDSVKIKYVIGVYGEALNEYLIKNSNLHFSMGTSALEAGKLGIPTVLIDPCLQEYPNTYLYTWLYNTKEFRLGHYINSSDSFCGMTMDQVLNTYNSPRKILEISNKTFLYVNKNHQLSKSVDILLNGCKSSNMYTNDIMSIKYFEYMLYYNKLRKLICRGNN